MGIRLDELPATGHPTVDALIQWVGTAYIVISMLSMVVPKDSPTARMFATFGADLRGVLVAFGRAEVPAPAKTRVKRSRKSS